MRTEFRRAARAAVLGLPLLASAALRAASLQVLNVSDDAPAASADFGPVARGAGHVRLGRYFKVVYPSTATARLSAFTDNAGWTGPASAPRGGLLYGPNPSKTAPLYWKAFPARQPGGPAFAPGDESSWRAAADRNDPGFSFDAAAAAVPLNAQGEAYIYLGAVVPAGTDLGAYGTAFVVRADPPPDRMPPAPPTGLRAR